MDQRGPTSLIGSVLTRARHPGHRDETATMVLLEDVSRRYELDGVSVTALAGVDLEVDEGEFVVVLGPSGSGKTTLLNLVGALDEATSGTVTVAGRRISGARRKDLFEFRRRTVSFIFQSFNLFPGLTAAENVRFGADVAGADADIDRILTDVGLGERRDHFPHELSGDGPPKGGRAPIADLHW
jgi:putative ABC transport system ATP-binding protein